MVAATGPGSTVRLHSTGWLGLTREDWSQAVAASRAGQHGRPRAVQGDRVQSRAFSAAVEARTARLSGSGARVIAARKPCGGPCASLAQRVVMA
jgi:hypothetical protein